MHCYTNFFVSLRYVFNSQNAICTHDNGINVRGPEKIIWDSKNEQRFVQDPSNLDLKELMSYLLRLLEKYHGGNYGSALCMLAWLHVNMNRRNLIGVVDNHACLNLYGLRNAGK